MPYLGKQPANVPVTADDIPDNSITSAKILDGVITIADIGANAVGNSEMADDAVGVAELSASGTASNTTFLRGDNAWAVVNTNLVADTSPQLGGNLDLNSNNITGTGGIPAANLTGSVAAARLTVATTQAESDNSTKLATTAYVTAKITTLIGGAPSTLNDLNELALAINDDSNYNSTLTTALATKLPLAGGTMTGTLVAPAITVGNSSIGSNASHLASITINNNQYIGSANATNAIQIPTAGGINVTGNIAVSGTVDGVDIATRDAILTSTTTTAGAALPKAGGTMTGALNITTSGTGMTFNTPSTSQNNWVTWKDGGTNKWEIGKNTGNNFYVHSYTLGSTVITLKETGNVGIGVTDPTAQLEIGHATGANLTLRRVDSAIVSGDNLGQINFTGDDPSVTKGGAVIQAKATTTWSANNYDSDLLFYLDDSAGNMTERMRIKSDGELLIGTTTQGRETNLAVVGANELPTGAWSQFGIYSNDSYAVDKGGSMMFGGQDGTTARSFFAAIKGAKENATSGNYAGYLAFYTRPAGAVPQERMRIDSNGTLSIQAGLKIATGTVVNTGNSGGTLSIQGGATYPGGKIRMRGGQAGGDFTVYTGASTSSPAEALTITSDGRGLSQFTAKVWVNFNGQNTVSIRDSHNVASITDNGTGDYSINFSNNMANDDYAVCSGTVGSTANWYSGIVGSIAPAVGSIRLKAPNMVTNNTSVTLQDPNQVNVIIFGD